MRRWRLAFLGFALIVGGIGTAIGIMSSRPAFGARPRGERRARIEASPEWRDGKFRNSEEMWNDLLGSIRDAASHAPEATPSHGVPHQQTASAAFATPPESGLRVTWFGHSSTLIEIDGVKILTDPIWSDRASPVDWAGPSRYFAPTITLADLPKLDAIVVSHDHYDHLDYGTVSAMPDTLFIVPLGIGAHLAYWGVADDHIIELDWWQTTQLGDVTVTATPARHASGRFNPRSGQTLWAGYAFTGPEHRAYYSGDTGFFSGLDDIGAKLGPFDVTLIESGQYDPGWPDWHLGPEQAVEAHRQVRGITMIPVHWALFTLAPHPWTEPVERVVVAAKCHNVRLLTPQPGQSIEPERQAPIDPWWPALQIRSADAVAIRATKNGADDDRFTLPPCETQ